MKNSFVWFLSLVIVLSIGTYFLLSNGDSVLDFGSINEQKDENKNTISKKSKPGENSNKNNNTNKIGDISGAEMDGEQRIKLQVTMAQVSPDGSSVFGGVGPVGQTVLLFDGDTIIAEAIINDKGQNINNAPPSSPVEILGINGAAKAGDDFIVLDNEKEAKILSENRAEEKKDCASGFACHHSSSHC